MTSKKITTLRRTAALLCAALTGLGLGMAARVSAQVTGPLGAPYTSPPTPTSFQWPNFHSGGAPVPAAQYPVAPNANAALGLTPLIDPLQGQLQGTPTELYNGSITQIPSFLLGNYDPTRPPGGLGGTDPTTGLAVNTYYPDHFADGSIFSWAAPFNYVSLTSGQVTVDDSAAPPTPAANGNPPTSGFTASGFTSVTAPGAATPGNDTSPAAEDATNAEYLRIAPGAAGSAVWTLFEPYAGNYSLYLHIPNDLPDSAGNTEPRSTQVTYIIRVLDANGNVTSSTTATASQTEANDTQFLAGPFQVATQGSVVVTLLRSSAVNPDPNSLYYIVADSMTLQTTIGDVQSAPTVITRTSFPDDFARAQYWGVYIPVSALNPNTSPDPLTAAAANAAPDTLDGTTNATSPILLKTGSTTTALGPNGYDPTRLIRQLVYFGRSDPAASITATVDDSAQAPTGTPPSGFTSSPSTPVTDATASNGEYKKYGTQKGLVAAATAVATWTIPVPAAAAGVSLFVTVHVPANAAATPETRLAQVYYTVTTSAGTSDPVAISQVTQGTDAIVTLPTGALTAAVGTSVVVKMFNVNNSSTVSPANGSVVVADSVNVTTGTGQGAVYCVDGFTGGILWRYQTPGSANGASAPVFASPTIARINVVVTPATATTPAVYANRLVVVVGDNNGLVYCLDAIGNGDGTSNFAVLNQTTSQPIIAPQPAYGAALANTVYAPIAAGTAYAAAAATAHVGTTGVYWIYRPDATQPKYVTGTNIGKVKPVDATSDLPVPASFSTASPNIFVDPTVDTGVVTAANPTPNAATASNSIIYIGNSNGVLYAIDGGGASLDGTTAATYAASGDTFNVSQTGTDFDVPTAGPNGPYPLAAVVPSAQPLWWFSLRGVDPNSADNSSSADIESAPALYVKATAVTPVAPSTATTAYLPTVYIGSAHEMEATSNVGRLYALNGLYGPSGNNGLLDPSKQPNPAAANYTGPGATSYNVGQRPQINLTDTTDWSFPDALGTDKYGTGKSTSKKPRPALGNITGSPVVFTNIDENAANTNADGSLRQTRIYIAANSGYEATTATPVPTARPDDTATGRIWAVNLDGSVGTTTNSGTGGNVWAYPLANDPNNAGLDNTPEPDLPIGSFLRGTPAIGFVQFPATTLNGDGTAYQNIDATGADVKSRSVPMLYVGTRGDSDTALYAVDIDGDMTTDNEGTATGTDTRTIYRTVSPDGSIFQSSVALVANATSAGGNGGAVYAVAGNTLFDYGATPITNPNPGEAYPLIRENAALIGYGPISSPAIVGADTTDLSTAFLATTTGTAGLFNSSGFTTNTTDWIIVGDSASGFCRGITPQDALYGGIPPALGVIVPPNPNQPGSELLNALIQTFLVKTLTNVSSSNALPIGPTADLPVYDWGESVYACFSNVAPPNTGTDPKLFVYDHTQYGDNIPTNPSSPIPFYTSDGTTAETVTFNLSDADTTATSPLLLDNGSVSVTNGYVADPGTLPTSFAATRFVQNLQTTAKTKYIGTYTYTIADGSARNNTPGARRRFQNVKQVVTEWDYNGGDATQIGSYTRKGTVVLAGDATGNNLVTIKNANGQPAFESIPPVDQPTFGILNPLAVRGGGVPIIPINSTAAVPIGDELGPFRGIQTGLKTATNASGDVYGLQALANGNTVPDNAPPSTSGVSGNPTRLPTGANDPAGVNAPTHISVVVTTTGEIPHNTTGSNQEPVQSVRPVGSYSLGDGLLANAGFGGYGLDVFDRSALVNLAQNLRLKTTVPTNAQFAPPSGKDGMYWNSNFSLNTTGTYPDNTGHDSVVNFLPWEVPPTSYQVGGSANGSQDYPDIAPGNITQTAASGNGGSGGDLTSSTVTLPPAIITGTAGDPVAVKSRMVVGDPVQIQVSVPNHQSANQQLYQQQAASSAAQAYLATGQIPPASEAGVPQISLPQVFPMGYVTVKRLYVPNATGFYSAQRPYRDVRIYTGVPVDMRTSVAPASAVTDIGKAPAAFGVQTEQYTTANNPAAVNPLGYFTPYGTPASGTNPPVLSPFAAYFKPLEIHNDGNVNLLNVHLDQKVNNGTATTLPLFSDAVDPLSFLYGYDLNTVTGPRTTVPLPGSTVAEEPFLIRSSLDTDLYAAYGHNSYLSISVYPGATFHKPIVGSDQPSILTVPDAPERYVPGASLPSSPTPIIPNGPGGTYKSQPFVSLALPFGTPVGTYHTAAATDLASLRLFEGLDSAAPNGYTPNTSTVTSGGIPNYLLPPQYGGAVGGIGQPNASTTTGQIMDSGGAAEDIYNGKQPLSSTGTQLIGTVIEQRLTDGATYGAVPMIDAAPAGSTTPAGGTAVPASTPDFAPAAFRDPLSGDLSVYWTSGRAANAFGIYGANLPFNKSGGYFLPTTPAGQWWQPVTPALTPGTNLAAGVNSGLSITQGLAGGQNYAFDASVLSTAPYSSTLYSYTADPTTGALTNAQAVTPPASTPQVKYGIRGLDTGTSFNSPSLWAFWTASARGRTAIYYNSQSNGTWLPAIPTVGVLPVPAGLTAVADASPLLLQYAPVNGVYTPVMEVTYSGTGPGGNIDLYVSRYRPHVKLASATPPDTEPTSQLDLVAFPPVTENLQPVSGWYQARDVAWSRTGALNVSVSYPGSNGPQPLLYSTSNVPQFRNAIFDKASGLLVLTGVKVPEVGSTATTTNTVTVDAATGRVRFSPALSTTTQNFTQIQATFSPQARRLTIDTRADTAPVTFMDTTNKPNDAAFVTGSLQTGNVAADRRWTIWRKSGIAGPQGSATLYFKTQRLTFFTNLGIDPTKAVTITLNGNTYPTSSVDLDYQRGRIYFPMMSDAEGQTATVTYTPLGGTGTTTWPIAPATETVQWQDEPLANTNTVPVQDAATGLDTIVENAVPIDVPTNENNVAAFLDPFAGQVGVGNALNPHKVWLFWNSTRNGTADIYSETIDPLFAPGPTTP